MDTKPLSVALVAAKKDGENIILRLAASNGHSYSLIFSPTCAGQSVHDFTGLPDTDEIVTLTPTRAWAPVRADNRQGIVIHTRERGTISIELVEGTISALQAYLGAILSTPRPAPKH
jgi:hypothetical protein